MKWPRKKTAQVGDHRWYNRFAWIPLKAYKQKYGCGGYDEYTVWLEWYQIHEEYKTMAVDNGICGLIGEDMWVFEARYVIERPYGKYERR